jgi:hypothetical protein
MPMMCLAVVPLAAMSVVGGVSAMAMVEEVAMVAAEEARPWAGWLAARQFNFFVRSFPNHHHHRH